MYKACSRSAFDQVAEHGYDDQGHRQRGYQRKEPRNSGLQRPLQRPDDGDDEQRERDGREN
jgi:hypothetical protein